MCQLFQYYFFFVIRQSGYYKKWTFCYQYLLIKQKKWYNNSNMLVLLYSKTSLARGLFLCVINCRRDWGDSSFIHESNLPPSGGISLTCSMLFCAYSYLCFFVLTALYASLSLLLSMLPCGCHCLCTLVLANKKVSLWLLLIMLFDRTKLKQHCEYK